MSKITDIKNAIEVILTNANLQSKGENVRIIMGEKARVGDLRPPAVWVFFEPSPISHAGSARAEEWSVRFIVASVVLNPDDPVVGAEDAEALASLASAALVTASAVTLNDTVRDNVRTNFYPGYSRGQPGENLYGAGFAHEARTRVNVTD